MFRALTFEPYYIVQETMDHEARHGTPLFPKRLQRTTYPKKCDKQDDSIYIYILKNQERQNKKIRAHKQPNQNINIAAEV